MSRPAPLRWPNGAKIAILPQLILEDWIGGHGGAKMLPKVPEEAIKAGAVDYAAAAWAAYGASKGAWRIFRLFRKYGIPATGIFSGLAVEKQAEFSRAWVDAGNEIAAHSYAQNIRIFTLSPEAERENVRKCVDVISRVTGYRAVGWNCPGGQRSERTTGIILDEGIYYSYNYKDDDRPHTAEIVGGKKMVAVPKLFDVNDMTTYAAASHPPSSYVEIFCRSFDVLYGEEQAHGGKMLSLSAHAALYGRPMGASALEECIRYAKSFPGVWFATGRDVADFWLTQCSGVASY